MKARLFLLAEACLIAWPLVGQADQDLQARFEKSLKGAQSISNVELVCLDTLSVKDPAQLSILTNRNTEFSRTVEFSYIGSGQNYRATSKLVAGTETNLAHLFESAFDGKNYATYTGDQRYMTTARAPDLMDNSESPISPLVAPFLFLTKYPNDRQGRLRFADISSEDFAKGFVLPEAQFSNGVIEVSMSGPSIGKQPSRWTIDLNETGDSFTPTTIKQIVPGREYMNVSRLLDYTNLGAYRFPRRIEYTGYSFSPASPPIMILTGTVTVTMARIPEKIDDSVFRLDGEETAASVIWDSDLRKLTKKAPHLIK